MADALTAYVLEFTENVMVVLHFLEHFPREKYICREEKIQREVYSGTGGNRGLIEEQGVVWMKEFKRDASKCSHDLTTWPRGAQQATTAYSPGRGRLRSRVQGEYALNPEVKRKYIVSRK